MKSVEEREVELIRIITRKMIPQNLLEYNPDNQSGMCPWCGQRLNMPIKRCTNCGQAVKWGMQCKDIEFGTGDCAYNVHLPWLVDGKAKMVNIDKCLLPEIIHLWELGIKTTGCCCGHGKTDMQEPFIGVEFEYIDKMLELGYKVCPNKYRPRDRDSFYPKTILKYGNADKGFNWWDSQEGCEVK